MQEKKAAENLDREAMLREQEIDNLTSSRHLEALNIKKKLNERGLQIFEVSYFFKLFIVLQPLMINNKRKHKYEFR